MSDLTDRLRRAPIPCVTTGQFDAGLCVCCEAAAALEAAEAKLAAIRDHCRDNLAARALGDHENGYDGACLDILDILEGQ